MTTQEFANKYGLSYKKAFECTYGVKPIAVRSDHYGHNQYRESDLATNLLAQINARRDKAAEKLEKLNEMSARLTEVILRESSSEGT